MLMQEINTLWSAIRGTQYAVFEADTSKIVFAFDSIDETSFTAESSITSYPTETGVLKTDYIYRQPSIIEMAGVCSKKSLLAQGFNALADKASTIKQIDENLNKYIGGIYNLNVQTKAGLRKGYTLKRFEIPETLENYGLFTVLMTFQEILGIKTKGSSLKNEINADTINAGIAQLLRL